MNKSRRMLLITQLSLALGATACLARHPLLGCGVALDPAYCKRVQTPVSIGSAVDPKDSVRTPPYRRASGDTDKLGLEARPHGGIGPPRARPSVSVSVTQLGFVLTDGLSTSMRFAGRAATRA